MALNLTPIAKHWTPKGVLSIQFFGYGADQGKLFICLDDNVISEIFSLEALESFNNGSYDDLLGFPAQSLNIPPNIDDWNDNRDEQLSKGL